MRERDKFDSDYLAREVMKEIYSLLEPEAESLQGHFSIVDNFDCIRCQAFDDRIGLVLRIPPELGSLFADETGKPLVLINVRLCDECIRWITEDNTREAPFVRKIMSSLVGQRVDA